MGSTAVDEVSRLLLCERPPLSSRIYLATKTSVVQTVIGLAEIAKSLQRRISPPAHAPDSSKSYECRPKLPVRLFVPSGYDGASSLLPTLFTIHGGGFCIGSSVDDDAWNRLFADTHSVLVVALNYAKAPANAFPGPLKDVQALLHAVLQDESLPIDKSRLAVAGFSAGGSLALTLARAETLKAKHGGEDYADFKAVVPIYPVLDHSVPPATVKIARRRWKVGMLSGVRGKKSDFVLPMADIFDWAYIPYGQDLRDPSMSPFYAAREDLPAHLFVIAAELDFLTWESWSFALKMAGKEAREDLPGREKPATSQDLEF